MRQNENGFVSLFMCIIISMLLIVITVSMVSLEALQLRKAEDSEQTLRAYYLAEAGVEDAVSKVLKGAIKAGTGDNTCNKSTTFDTPGAAEWTCQYVSFSGNPTGNLEKADFAKTVDPGNVDYKSVIVEWNQSDSTVASFYNVPGGLLGNFPTANSYTYAPPLELTVLEYPPGGFAASDVPTLTKLQNVLLVPNGASSWPHGRLDYGSGLSGNGPQPGDCGAIGRSLPPSVFGAVASAQYNCFSVLANLPAGQNFLFRIRSRYSASSYKLTFKANPNGNGAIVPVPDGTATIDVTAKAGDTYRRVISKLPLGTGAAAGLNFVIYSDTDVCKNFTVINNAISGSGPGC